MIKDGWLGTGDVATIDDGRLSADRRSQEGHDSRERLQRVSQRSRGGAGGGSAGRGSRRARRAGSALRRGGRGVHRPARSGADGRRRSASTHARRSPTTRCRRSSSFATSCRSPTSARCCARICAPPRLRHTPLSQLQVASYKFKVCMDNLCHTLAGAALGEAGLKQRTALGMSTLLIASNLPDIDVGVFATSTLAMSFRRGWTHGVLALVVLPVALTAAMRCGIDWRRSAAASPASRAAACRLASWRSPTSGRGCTCSWTF